MRVEIFLAVKPCLRPVSVLESEFLRGWQGKIPASLSRKNLIPSPAETPKGEVRYSSHERRLTQVVPIIEIEIVSI
jgi:hypothetical protein